MKKIQIIKKKKKKIKKSVTVVNQESPKAELLDIQNVRENMLLLGCIIEIRSDRLLVSLPGCLVGTVPITNISVPYTEVLKNSSEKENSDEITLENLFELGSTYPCKILKIAQYESKKPIITLSIDPHCVNSNLNPSCLYNKMVLYSAVSSIEDRGYVMDVGIKGLKGFLSFNAAHSDKLLTVGQVIPTQIRKITSPEGGVLSLAGLNFEEDFPEIPDEEIKLPAILPGACISGYISEVTQNFLYLKCINYDACACTISLPDKNKKFEEAVSVTGKVLYVHPITHLIYIHLGKLPTPQSFQNFFNLQKYDKIKNLRFHESFNHKLYFKCKNLIGYVKAADVAGKTTLSYDSLLKNPFVPKARVVFLHYMDNLIQLTFKESQLKMKIVKLEEVKIGDIYEAIVKKHVEDGMFVSICPGLQGFVRHIFFSDSFISMPEKLFPVETSVKCRVLSIHPTLGLNLTCKESILNMPDSSVLKSYEDAEKGNTYKGVIVKKTDNYIVIAFFNNVQGIVGSDHIPGGSVFYVGQTVTCAVLYCSPLKGKLGLSLKVDEYRSKENQSDSNQSSSKSGDASTKISSKNTDIKDIIAYSFSQSLAKPEFLEGKTYKAIIKKITAHQLNVLVEGTEKGRIHITQSGCNQEGALPFQQFKVGQGLKIYVLKEYERHSRNFLAISHQNKSSFLECSLIPTSTLNRDFGLNQPMLSFVKKVFDGFAVVWLSPYQCGTLDFVNLPKSAKELRKFKKHMKVGQSLTVSVFSITEGSENEDGKIRLTTPDVPPPSVGKNVNGFVIVASIDRGLIVKLPHGYTGNVCLTDIQDEYTPIQRELDKLLKLKFILCHVLEANHDKKFCILSLRKSRLYCKQNKNEKNICPEITRDTIEKGQQVKGYILSVFETHMLVSIGRKLNGKLEFQKCVKYGCLKCSKAPDVLESAVVGNVIEVVVENCDCEQILLSLPGVCKQIGTESTGLQVKEDINWDELQ